MAQIKVQDAVDDASEQLITIQAELGVPTTEKLRQVYIDTFLVSDNNEVEIGLTLEVVSGNQTTVQLPSITLD